MLSYKKFSWVYKAKFWTLSDGTKHWHNPKTDKVEPFNPTHTDEHVAQGNSGLTLLSEITDADVRSSVVSAFSSVAAAQRTMERGSPEWWATGLNSPINLNCGGMYRNLAENVGDLTHRLTERAISGDFGYISAGEKIRRVLGYFSSDSRPNPEDEIENDLRNNYEGQVLAYTEGKRDKPKEFDEWLSDVRGYGRSYASAHSKVPVYNAAQYHAREAAVSLGNFDLSSMRNHLEELNRHLDDSLAWDQYAGQVKLVDGVPQLYVHDKGA
jgi:hypothetical protein